MELFLFALDDRITAGAQDAGLDAVVVDLEHRGKGRRQQGFDTGISRHTLDDVERVRSLTELPLVVRVDRPSPDLGRRMRQVLDAGADEVLVPMVTDAEDAAGCLEAAPGGTAVGVLVERQTAVDDIGAFGGLPLRRLYLGLMDLMVERNASSPFEALVDGTGDDVGGQCPVPFGTGGLTLPGYGAPCPVELLAGELCRLGAQFTFLRRSFLSDLARSGTPLPTAVQEVRRMLSVLRARPVQAVERDRRAFAAAVGRGTAA